MKRISKPNFVQRTVAASSAVIASIVLPLSGHSDVITQTVDNLDWNADMWGSPAAAPTAGNDYVSALGGTDRFRIGADGSSTTFGGDSLTVVSGTRALSKLSDGNTGTINGDFILDGGRLSFAPNGSSNNTTLAVSSFVVSTDSLMDVGASTDHSTVDGVLTGSGGITFSLENSPSAEPYDQYITFTGISSYTGALTVTENLGLEFGVDYSFANMLTLQDADTFLVVNSGQTLTFGLGNLVDSNGMVPAGTYTGGSLDALGANYLNLGGTIIVTPEPSSLALGCLAGGLMLLVRFQRKQ